MMTTELSERKWSISTTQSGRGNGMLVREECEPGEEFPEVEKNLRKK